MNAPFTRVDHVTEHEIDGSEVMQIHFANGDTLAYRIDTDDDGNTNRIPVSLA
jgi:hypothetical protein